MRAAQRRWLLRLLVLSLCLGALWLVLFRGYADYLARIEPTRSLRLNPAQSEALVLLADRAVDDDRLDDALGYARRALDAAPLEGRALRVFAAEREFAGDVDAAAALMQAAVRRSPRDVSAQLWLAIQAMQEEDLEAALYRIDRLLRFQPEALQQLRPLLTLLASNRVAVNSLVRTLARDPPWRESFMVGYARNAASSEELRIVAAAFDRAGAVLSESERQAWVERLQQAGEWTQMRALSQWDRSGSLLVDGEFDGETVGDRPGWTLGRIAGADVGIETARDHDHGRALRVGFYGSRVAFAHVEQMLLLEAGHYRLSGRYKLERLDAAQGLRWRLECLDGSKALIGYTQLFRGDAAWSDFALDFIVPDTDCGAQRLRLEQYARIAAEQEIRGVAWFDGLQIQSIAATQSLSH